MLKSLFGSSELRMKVLFISFLLYTVVSSAAILFTKPTISHINFLYQYDDYLKNLTTAAAATITTPASIDKASTVTPIPNPCSDESVRIRNYFFPYPGDASKYIQCDDYNNMAVGYCENSTTFNFQYRVCM